MSASETAPRVWVRGTIASWDQDRCNGTIVTPAGDEFRTDVVYFGDTWTVTPHVGLAVQFTRSFHGAEAWAESVSPVPS